MLKRYGEKALEESAARADELAAEEDSNGAAVQVGGAPDVDLGYHTGKGAACVFWAIMTWRAIVNGRINGSPTACGVQFVFGVLCINIVTVANGVVSFFQIGS